MILVNFPSKFSYLAEDNRSEDKCADRHDWPIMHFYLHICRYAKTLKNDWRQNIFALSIIARLLFEGFEVFRNKLLLASLCLTTWCKRYFLRGDILTDFEEKLLVSEERHF